MKLAIQKISQLKHIPHDKLIKKWINATAPKNSSITIRIINKSESAKLNKMYRSKMGPTNVLSFVYTKKPVNGDIVLCAPLIKDKQNWAHLIIHGVLHLMGYDHLNDKDARKMEMKEIKLLSQLGFGNPYDCC